MINTFKIGGVNYNNEIGEINDGKDYAKNEYNKYTLYIPQEALNKKDNYNGIILFIHGEDEKKENIEYYCSRYAKNGYITAAMDYTELSKNIENSNAFRVLDEITNCLNNTKKILVNEYKFNGNKLELSLGGISDGAYLAMLYGYSMKNKSPIPIKLIINLAGYLDFGPNNWYKISKFNDTLTDLEPKTIIEAINNKKITKIHEKEDFYLKKMYEYLGKKYTEEQINQMLTGNKINPENENYKTLYNSAKPFFFFYHINKIINNDYIPILSEYGGNDEKIGIAHFKYLKEIQEKNNNFTTDIVYMKYANHSLINYDTENGIKAMRDIHTKILKYSNLYFKDENYDIENMNKFLDNGGRIESWHFLYGYKLENLSYVKNGIIDNTYKLGSINYKE